MAYENPMLIKSWDAGADLSANEFQAVKFTGTDIVGLCTVNGELCIGVLQNKPKSGVAADIMVEGISRAYAGAAIVQGAKVMTNASGQFVTATTGNNVVGIAYTAASALGDIFALKLANGGGLAP